MDKLEFPEDTFRSFDQICRRYGYTPETHKVVTQDGYINTLFRVYKRGRGKYNSVKLTDRPVVLLNHGLIDSSDAWIINGKDSPAFMLADEGYDVWVTNSRGNGHSQHHLKLNPETDPAFWDFSFAEIAKFDLPAFIMYIRRYAQMPDGK